MGKDREPTRLGQLILQRMTDLGMRRQAELVRRAAGIGWKLSDSTVSRLIYNDASFDRETLLGLAHTLDLDPSWLVLYAYGLTDIDAMRDAPPAVHPRAVEIEQMLADDSPLPAGDREILDTILDRVIASYRPLMRSRRPA